MDVRGAGWVPAGGDGDEVDGPALGVRDRHVHHLAQAASPPFTERRFNRKIGAP